MEMKKVIAMICSICMLGTIVGCSKQAQAAIEERYIPVKAVVVKIGGIQKVDEYTGQIQPTKEVDLISKTPGKVKRIYFDIGDVVNEGDVLFTLDEVSVENMIKQLKSQVQSAQAQVDLAQLSFNKTKGSIQEKKIMDAKTELEKTKITYENVKRDYKNAGMLYEAGSIPQKQYDQAKDTYKTGKRAYENMQRKYELLMGQQLKEDIEDAKSQLNEALASRNFYQAQLDNALYNLQDLQVKSPIKGVVAKRNVNVGEMTGIGTPAYTIVNMDTVCVTIQISDKMINKFQLNQKVDVYVKAVQNHAFTGTVKKISPIADEGTMTYPVKIEIENSQDRIKPGMFAEVVFEVEKKDSAIVIPRKALKLEGDQWFAYMIENDRTKKVRVEIGIDNGTEVEIKKGLEKDQKLIVQGKEYVIEGEKVKIIN